MNRHRMFFLALTLLCLLAAAGCGGSGSSTEADSQTASADFYLGARAGDEPITVTSRHRDLEFTLTLPKTRYAPGEAVPITMTMRNTGTQEVRVTTGNQIFDVSAWHGDTLDWSYVVGGHGGIMSWPLAPGEVKTDSLTWNQRKNVSNNLRGSEEGFVAPGTYTLRAGFAEFSPDGLRVSLPPVEITIDPSLPALGDYRDLRITLSLPRTRFLIGESVPMTLTVTNTGSNPIVASGIYPTPRLHVSGPDHGYDTPFPGNDAPTTTEVFQPGETKTYSTIWEQQYNVAYDPKSPPRPASPGTHSVRAALGYHIINGAGVNYDRLSAPSVEIKLFATAEEMNAPWPPPVW